MASSYRDSEAQPNASKQERNRLQDEEKQAESKKDDILKHREKGRPKLYLTVATSRLIRLSVEAAICRLFSYTCLKEQIISRERLSTKYESIFIYLFLKLT
jgi:hypothetical protein